MTRADLLEVVYRFYPRGLLEGTEGYSDSEACRRHVDVTRRGIAGYPAWAALLDRLRARYSLMDCSWSLLAGVYDAGYSGFVEIAGYALGFHVSLLGPYYGIHRTLAAGEEPARIDLAREIEATYPGYEPIPPELGSEVVPDVGIPGETTIYRCLLSDGWEWISGPLPPPAPWPDDDVEPAGVEAPDPGGDEGGSDPPLRWQVRRR
jgi:hypothetical protein